MEKPGMAMFAIPGHEAVLKISRPMDLVIAEALL
jgi:hypothetical protein